MASVPLCQHIKTNGELCGCPALKDRRFCYFHDQAERRRRANARRNARQTLPRKYTFKLPLLEDANAIQVAIMETIEALLDGRINHRYAGLIFYALQTASANLKHTTFKATGLKPRDAQLDELLDALRAIPDPNEKPKLAETPAAVLVGAATKPDTVVVGAADLGCPGEQSSPRSSSVTSAPSALINPPSNGPITRSHDGTIPKIHAAAEQKDEPSFRAEPRLVFSASSSTRSRRSRGTCISPPCILRGAAQKTAPLGGTLARPNWPFNRQCENRQPSIAVQWHDGTITLARSYSATLLNLLKTLPNLYTDSFLS